MRRLLLSHNGRVFTRSDGSRYQQLSLKRIGVSFEDEEKELHERILNARNKKYAHADLDFAHVRIDAFPMIKRDDFTFLAHRVQWDEGLEFIGDMLTYKVQNWLGKLKLGLYEKTNDLVQELNDHLPIYLRPDNFDEP